jgi:hypothetical protein
MVFAYDATGPMVCLDAPAVITRFAEHRRAVDSGELRLIEICADEQLHLASPPRHSSHQDPSATATVSGNRAFNMAIARDGADVPRGRIRGVSTIVVIVAAVALPVCALVAIAFDVSHVGAVLATGSPLSGQPQATWPIAAGNPLFSADSTTPNPAVSDSKDVGGVLHQRVTFEVLDSTTTVTTGGSTTTVTTGGSTTTVTRGGSTTTVTTVSGETTLDQGQAPPTVSIVSSGAASSAPAVPVAAAAYTG